MKTFMGWDIIDRNGIPVAWFLERCDADDWLDICLGKDRMTYEIKSAERKIEIKVSSDKTIEAKFEEVKNRNLNQLKRDMRP